MLNPPGLSGEPGQEKGHALSQAHRLGCQYTTAT